MNRVVASYISAPCIIPHLQAAQAPTSLSYFIHFLHFEKPLASQDQDPNSSYSFTYKMQEVSKQANQPTHLLYIYAKSP